MKRFGFCIELTKPENIDEYKRLHRNVPLEIEGKGGALEEIGLTRMSIYFLPDNKLFMQVEANDNFDPLEGFSKANTLDPEVQKWDDNMHDGENSLLKRLVINNTKLNWLKLEQIYDWEIEKIKEKEESS